MLKQLSGLWSAIEALILLGLGTCLFIGLFVVLPLTLARDLVRDAPLLAAGLVTVCILTLATTARDALRRRWSWASRVVFGLWFLCVLLVVLAA